MAAALGPLGHDHIHPGLSRTLCFCHLASHMHDKRSGIVYTLHIRSQILVWPGPREGHHRRVALQSRRQSRFLD